MSNHNERNRKHQRTACGQPGGGQEGAGGRTSPAPGWEGRTGRGPGEGAGQEGGQRQAEHQDQAKPSTKIKWTATSDKDSRGDCEATGTVSDRRYAITKDGDSWKAVVTVGKGKATVLAEGLKTGRAAWSRCVADAKSVAA